MLLKTKLLLSLGTLGISGGVGAGVYYIKNRKVESKPSEGGAGEDNKENTLGGGSNINGENGNPSGTGGGSGVGSSDASDTTEGS